MLYKKARVTDARASRVFMDLFVALTVSKTDVVTYQ